MKATQFVNRQKDFCPKDLISLFSVRTVRTVQQNHGKPYADLCGTGVLCVCVQVSVECDDFRQIVEGY